MSDLQTLFDAREAAETGEEAMRLQYLIDEHKRLNPDAQDLSPEPPRRSMTQNRDE